MPDPTSIDIESMSLELLQERVSEWELEVREIRLKRDPTLKLVQKLQRRWEQYGDPKAKEQLRGLQTKLRRFKDDLRELHDLNFPYREALWNRRTLLDEKILETANDQRSFRLESAFVEVARVRLTQVEFDKIMQSAAVMCSHRRKV